MYRVYYKDNWKDLIAFEMMKHSEDVSLWDPFTIGTFQNLVGNDL